VIFVIFVIFVMGGRGEIQKRSRRRRPAAFENGSYQTRKRKKIPQAGIKG
jgi:hypothetical protein